MDKDRLKQLLEAVKNNTIQIDEALHQLKTLPYADLGFAKLDTHRDLRTGFPEVIYCRGKTLDQICRIVEKLSSTSDCVMATKADEQVYAAIREVTPEAIYYDTAKIVLVNRRKTRRSIKKILLVSAGTADIPVAEEAAVTAEIMGNSVDRLYDIGVAGVHRLFSNQEVLFRANVIVIVAGMEGALASVIGGLVDKPVIAVPTSVGYGASFEGLAALLSMLNCCAPGVVVVNIDNGFGAGYFAGMINQMGDRV